MLNLMPDRVFRVSRDGDNLDFKGTQEDTEHGMVRETVIGSNLRQFVPPDVAERCLSAIARALETGTLQVFEYQIPKAWEPNAGEMRDYEVRVVVSGAEEVLAIERDITDRKRAEAALRRSEERNRAFLNAIPDLMFRIARDGTYLDFKADQEQDFAFPADEMLGRTVYDVLPADIAQQRMHYIEQALKTRETQVFEYPLLNHGEVRDYEGRIVVSGEDEVLAIMRDITDRKRTEAQLRINTERDRLLGQIALRIHRSLNLDQILTTTVAEVRQFLQADRVFIGQIDQTWQGRVVAESAAPEWGSILAWIADDIYLREIRVLFEQGQVQAIDDTTAAEVSPLLAEYYARCQIKASLGVPITLGDDFFGVLIANQCSTLRHWQPFEVELLSQLATQVAIAIQQAELYQQVQTLNANLEYQVQERTAQLQQKMLELQELDHLKDDFLHAVSHDLRTPVMGMLLVLKNLQSKCNDTITLSRSILDRMVQSCDRQLAMINSLLEAHSSETRGVILNYELVNLGTLTRTIAADLEPLLAENQATLINLVPDDLPFVTADPAQIQRVFENLITNALKHNPIGLTVTLKADVEDEWIRCSIQDTGMGINQTEQESLFDRYVRGSRARRSAGIGLGLYLCRQIITAHGGQIGVISALGQGATFWFTLPLAVNG
jgi:PAS domain S-box-containing protein